MFKRSNKFFLVTTLLTTMFISVSAQKTMSVDQFNRASYDKKLKVNPYSVNYKSTAVNSFGIFFAEFNPYSWCYNDEVRSDTPDYSWRGQGVSIGFTYFVPFGIPLGLDLGAKGQYFFRNKTIAEKKYTFDMFSLTAPINLAYDWILSSSFAVHPYAGLYGRYTFSANSHMEINGKRDHNKWLEKDHPMGGMKRFMTGWQVGANVRISDMVSIGAAYWSDFGKATDYNHMHGFNIMLGAAF